MNDVCVNPDMVNDRTRTTIEVSFEGLGMDEFNSSEIADLLNEMSGGTLFIRETDIGSELDENGQVLRVFITVDKEYTEPATVVIKTLNTMNKGTNCDIGVLCRSTNAQIQLVVALSGVKSIHNTSAFILTAFIMVMTMMNCVVSV